MIYPRVVAGCLLVLAMAAGTVADPPSQNPLLVLGGYRVLAADFHVHSFPLSWSTLAPWDVVREAQRHGLDVVAVAGHNHLWVPKIARWYSDAVGGPRVLVSQEILNDNYHMIAAGIEHRIGWRLPAAVAARETQRQGGYAIAAHPVHGYWFAYDEDAMRAIDAAEIVQPIVYELDGAYSDLQQFFARAKLTAIGSSDYHGLPYPGLCRTYVFAKDDSQQAILEALRAGRTVAYDRDGRVYGDPALILLAARAPRLAAAAVPTSIDGIPAGLSRIAGILGLFVLFAFRRPAD